MNSEQDIIAGDEANVGVFAVVLVGYRWLLLLLSVLLLFLPIITLLPYFPLVHIPFVIVVSIPLDLLIDWLLVASSDP